MSNDEVEGTGRLMTDYAPGTIARITLADGYLAAEAREQNALRDGNSGWAWATSDGIDRWAADRNVTAVRALPIIDPDSPDDMQRLVGALRDQGWLVGDAAAPNELADALREYANPTPPPLAEPTDLAARVIDRDGDLWAAVGNGKWGCLTAQMRARDWSDLATYCAPLRLAGSEQ